MCNVLLHHPAACDSNRSHGIHGLLRGPNSWYASSFPITLLFLLYPLSLPIPLCHCFPSTPFVRSVPKYCRERVLKRGKAAKVIPRSVLGSWVRAGQRAWLQPGGCTLMGCRCPISDGQGWAKAQLGRARNRTKRETRTGGLLEDT